MEHFKRACSQARECRSQRLTDDALKSSGYQHNEFGLHPDDFPLFEPFTGGVPQDAMHTLYCKLPLLAPPQPPPFNRVYIPPHPLNPLHPHHPPAPNPPLYYSLVNFN